MFSIKHYDVMILAADQISENCKQNLILRHILKGFMLKNSDFRGKESSSYDSCAVTKNISLI
jgi:hypothetical protein